MKFQHEEIGGRIAMANQHGQTKKPFRQEKPKEKRKPDYTGARQQKRGELQD